MSRKTDIQVFVDKIADSRKYRHTGIPRQTIEDVLIQELARFPKETDAQRSARAILHNIMAPYLGNPDYETENSKLGLIDARADKQGLEEYCREILTQHDSTRERLPYLADFYNTILEVVPEPQIVLDLACGLNPFALPFMGLPDAVQYHAYDIHQPRVALINYLFTNLKLKPLAEMRDVLLDPPQVKADVAFLFKEAHRMEKRCKGCSRSLVHALNAKIIFISLPSRSLDGQRDLHQRMDRLFNQISSGLDGETGSHEFQGETLYWIRKTDG